MKCKNVECEKVIKGKQIYCSLSCRSYYVNKYLRNYSENSSGLKKKKQNLEKEYLKGPKFCLTCKTILPFIISKNKFCNSSCAAKTTNKSKKGLKHKFSKESLEKIAASNRKRIGYESTKIFYLNCVICQNLFVAKREIKTCNKECKNKLISINSTNNPNCGGETNFKKFKFKGICFDSSWEVEIAQLMDSLNIEWVRDRTLMFVWIDEIGKKRRYYPDFYLPKFNVYLDPKNKYRMQLDEFKIKQVLKDNPIELIVGEKEKVIKFIKNLV